MGTPGMTQMTLRGPQAGQTWQDFVLDAGGDLAWARRVPPPTSWDNSEVGGAVCAGRPGPRAGAAEVPGGHSWVGSGPRGPRLARKGNARGPQAKSRMFCLLYHGLFPSLFFPPHTRHKTNKYYVSFLAPSATCSPLAKPQDGPRLTLGALGK